MNGVVFVAGIYGVGRSTLCERISSLIHMPFYSAGDLISEQVGEIYGENKKVRNKDQNQNVLIECISQKIVKEQMFWHIIGKRKPVINLKSVIFPALQKSIIKKCR